MPIGVGRSNRLGAHSRREIVRAEEGKPDLVRSFFSVGTANNDSHRGVHVQFSRTENIFIQHDLSFMPGRENDNQT